MHRNIINPMATVYKTKATTNEPIVKVNTIKSASETNKTSKFIFFRIINLVHNNRQMYSFLNLNNLYVLFL